MRSASAACDFASFSEPCEFSPLKATEPFSAMPGPGQSELCEQCGSPLDESGLCWSCSGGGFQSGSSPVGAAPLEKSELAKVLGRGIGDKAHGAYSLSMQQAEGMSHLREEIESLVEQFNASPQTKNSVKQGSERNAVKLLPELGPTKAAVASVAQEFLNLGRSMAEVSFYIARVHPRVGRLSSLVLEVYAPDEGRAPERPGELPEAGLQVLLGRAVPEAQDLRLLLGRGSRRGPAECGPLRGRGIRRRG